MTVLTILQGDALEKLRELPPESMQCCVTSPPYWGLRDYGTAAWEGGDEGCDHKSGRFERGGLSSKQASNNGSGGDEARSECKCGAKRIDSQLGLEKTPEEYVGKMVEIFREVRRILRKDGTLWLNLGDSYAGSVLGYESLNRDYSSRYLSNYKGASKGHSFGAPPGLKPKDLCGIPWRVAFALQADGWWLRSDIIWAKPNPMPESVTDRPTKSHEYLFLLTKSASYFFDAEAIKEKVTTENPISSPEYRSEIGRGGNNRGVGNFDNGTTIYPIGNPASGNRNKRSVWTVATAPYPEAHFATYPPDLIKPCILAGTSAKGCCGKCGAPWERIVEKSGGTIGKGGWTDHTNDLQQGLVGRANINGRNDLSDYKVETLGWQPTCPHDAPVVPCTVLDCFGGSGTTGAVALELGRKAVLIELNPKYVALIEERCNVTMGLALA